MTRFRMLALAVIACLTLSACRCPAEDDSLLTDNFAQRLADLEAEVDFLRSSQAQAGSRSCGHNCGCLCCPVPHWEVGAEVAFLSPHSTTGLGPSGIAYFASPGLFPSWRTWLGYTGSKGLGLRARYWEFNHVVTGTVFTYALDTYVLDLEMTYSKVIGSDWNVLLSGGVRHVGLREGRTINAATAIVNTDSTGVLVGGEITRNLIGGLRGYGVARAAAVFGNMRGEVPPGFIVLFDNRLVCMWEAQLGVEYSRETQMGELSLRVGAEVQHWDEATYKNNGPPANPLVDAESIGFVGIVTGLTLRR
jgi:hypothetical protein